MLNSTTPIFVLLIGIIFFHTKAKLINIVGLIIGFIGTLALVSKNPSSLSNWNIGAFVILIASLLYGINTNFIKTQLKQIDSLSIPAFAFFFIGPLAIIYLLSTNLHSTIHNPNFWLSTASIATLAFISSFLALIIFNLVIKHTSAIFASTPTYLMPIIGIMWGLIDHEKISIQQIFAITIILTGVSLVNKNKTIIKKTQIKTQQ
jgi:drug/metabolite transporter (DMT)-like permease